MNITSTPVSVSGLRLLIQSGKQEIAHAFLYFLKNNLHDQPLAYLEDVFVNEMFRGQGFGRKIVERAIAEAKKAQCYKVVATSRFSNETAQSLYTSCGFEKHSHGFRLNLGF